MGRDQKWTTRTSRGRGAAAVATVLIVSLMALPVVGTPAAATFPGEDGIIAWKEVVVGGWNCNAGAQIMTANPDGTDVRVRTAGHSPEFSPDGTRLAFSDGVTEGADVWITDLVTGSTQLITSGYNPSWAPDGSRLAIQRSDGLYIYDLSSGSATQLLESGEYYGGPAPETGGAPYIYTAEYPAWSPDGQWIAFAMHAAWVERVQGATASLVRATDVYRIRPDGTGLTNLTNELGDLWPVEVEHPQEVSGTTTYAGWGQDSPAWLPDGSGLTGRSTNLYGDPPHHLIEIAFGGGYTVTRSVDDRLFDFVGVVRSPSGGSTLWSQMDEPDVRSSLHVDGNEIYVAPDNRLICGQVDWAVAATDGPTAVCATDPWPTPGQIGFSASDSIDRAGGGLLYEWDLGDGTTESFVSIIHNYTTPGDYTVSLTVTDVNELTDTTTCSASVAAPDLEVAVSFPGIDPALFALDDTVPVRVRLSASSDGVGALSDVTFVDPLSVAPTTALTISGGAEPPVPAGLELQPGESTFFDYELAPEHPGSFTVSATATATAADGALVGPVEGSREGRVGALDVEVEVEPAVVHLEEGPDEDGPLPEPVTVTVKVTNPFDEPITDVVLSVNDPHLVTTTVPPLGYRAFMYLVPDPDDPDGDRVHGRPDDVELGDIPGGATVEHEFDGEALARGDVELRVLATGSYDGNLVPGAAVGELTVATDVLFVFDADIDPSSHWMQGGAPWVDGGNDWRIDGSFENRTHDETFEVLVLPMREFNAGNGIPVPHLEPAIADECAVGVVRQVEPGETVEWAAPVHTSPTGTTRSQISYAPEVFVIAEDGGRVPLDAEHVLVTTGSDEHLVRVDTRDHPPEVPGAGALLHTFSEAAAEEFSDSVHALLGMGAEILTLGLQPWEWPAAYQASSDRFVEYIVSIYEDLSPADRAAWDADWKAMVALSTGMALTDANNLVNEMALESFTELQDAWVAGDWETTASWMGRQVGANPDVALGALVKAAGVCKLASQRSPWARNALAAKEAKIAEDLASLGANANAANFPTGAKISRQHRRTIWGIDDAMHAKVQAFVDEFGISIGVRRRGPGSIDKIEAGTHNPKSFHNKGKNTSATDRDWLGFVDDLDTAAIKQPPPYSEVVQQLNAAGVNPDVRAQVLARHRTRTKEWYGKGPEPGAPGYQDWLETGAGADFTKSERFKWAQYSVPLEQGGGIPVPKKGAPLDYRDNVSAGRSLPSDDVLYDRAPARIRTVEGPDGRPQMILETDRGTGFKPDTGDMDPLVVTKADLELLPEAKRLKFYDRAHELGFEHVESASWNDVAGRNQYLLEHAIEAPGRPQGEAMFQWVPNSEPRATRFDPQRSWHDPSDELNAGRFFLHGADVYLKTADPEPSSYTVDDSADYAGHVSPKSVTLVHPDCPGAVSDQGAGSVSPASDGAGSCNIAFDRGPDAIVFRQTDEGTNEVWTETDGWQPWEGPVGDPVGVLPQSVLNEPAEAGTTRLEIASANDLGLVAGDEWFAVGDVVIIDPGGANEQPATIGAFGSLIVTDPIHHSYPAGTLVSVVQALGDPTDPVDPNGPDRPDDPGTPSEPEQPGGPGLPGSPGTPSVPGEPQGPGTPGEAGVSPGGPAPGGPAVPDDAAGRRVADGGITRIASASTATGSLPRTGIDLGPLVALAVLLFAVGVPLARLGRRRTPRDG